MSREAVIVSAARTAIGRAKKGTLKDMRADDMAAVAINADHRARGNKEGNRRRPNPRLRHAGSFDGNERG